MLRLCAIDARARACERSRGRTRESEREGAGGGARARTRSSEWSSAMELGMSSPPPLTPALARPASRACRAPVAARARGGVHADQLGQGRCASPPRRLGGRRRTRTDSRFVRRRRGRGTHFGRHGHRGEAGIGRAAAAADGAAPPPARRAFRVVAQTSHQLFGAAGTCGAVSSERARGRAAAALLRAHLGRRVHHTLNRCRCRTGTPFAVGADAPARSTRCRWAACSTRSC